jgi:hypothetical protein
MAMRWRDREAREEDRKKRRLPSDWHDWMMCPAEDGHKSTGCTCELSLSNAPREAVMRDRALRETLDRELSIPIKDRLRGVRSLEDGKPQVVEWVKSIDAREHSDSMAIRRQEHAQVSRGLVAQDSRLARLGARSIPVRAPASGHGPRHRAGRRSDGRLGGSARVRLPSWLTRIGRYLSGVRTVGSEAR